MPVDDLNWDDLRYFVHAARAGTLAGAARAMGVEHTTIGRRLSALERSFAAPLFLRGPEGLTLTPLGEAIAPLVEMVERTILMVREHVASQKTRVVLAVPSGFTQFFLPWIAQFRQDHARVSLEIITGARPVDLSKGEADLAIRIGPIADKDLVVRKLGEAGWSLYASESYLARRPAPSDPDDLTGHDVIGYDASMVDIPAAKWIEQRAATATIVLRSREMTEMLTAALGGVGLAVLPCSLADDDPRLRRLTHEVVATRPLSLAYRRESRLSKEVRAVIRFVVDVVRGHAHRIAGVR